MTFTLKKTLTHFPKSSASGTQESKDCKKELFEGTFADSVARCYLDLSDIHTTPHVILLLIGLCLRIANQAIESLDVDCFVDSIGTVKTKISSEDNCGGIK